MQEITKHLNALFQQSSESSEQQDVTPQLLTSHHVNELWRRMSRIFGHRWVTNFGEQDDGTWLEGLRGMDAEDLANGLRATINDNEEWPPSLPVFRNHCLDITESGVRTYAKLLIKNELGSFDYNQVTTKDLEKRIKSKMKYARDRLVVTKIEINNQLRLEANG